MNDGNHLSQGDLALYAMRGMPEAELAAAREHVQGCADCRAEVEDLQRGLVVYAMTADMKPAPAQARERFLRSISKDKKPIPINRLQAVQAVEESAFPARTSSRAEDLAPAKRHGLGVLTWTGWAVAAGLAVVAGIQYQHRQSLADALTAVTVRLQASTDESARAQQVLQTLTDAHAMQVALNVPAAPGTPPKPQAHAAYVADTGRLVLVASHLAPLEANKTYELWLLPAAEGQQPIPAGLFKPDPTGNASVVLPDLPKGVAAKGFGVTIEAEGGAKAPTPPIVLAGME
jgi:Anti-sigma-K factor rskA